MNLGRMRKRDGFTLIEILLVVAILAVLALLAIPRFVSTIQDSKNNVDIANLEILNSATATYAQHRNTVGHVFDGISGDNARMQALVDARFLGQAVTPQQQGSSFVWNEFSQTWELSSSGPD